jgi:hypothetical protein
VPQAMMHWLYIRLGIVVLAAVLSLFAPLTPAAVPPIGWGALLAILCLTPFGLVFVVGLQTSTRQFGKAWRRPSWNLNPFTLFEPLQFFHLAAFASLAYGAILTIRLKFTPVPFYAEVLVPITMGIGLLLGIRLCMLLFRSKLEPGT